MVCNAFTNGLFSGRLTTWMAAKSAAPEEIVVGHRTDAGVGPYVFSRFHHVDDGIDGQDDAEDGDGGTDA